MYLLGSFSHGKRSSSLEPAAGVSSAARARFMCNASRFFVEFRAISNLCPTSVQVHQSYPPFFNAKGYELSKFDTPSSDELLLIPY